MKNSFIFLKLLLGQLQLSIMLSFVVPFLKSFESICIQRIGELLSIEFGISVEDSLVVKVDKFFNRYLLLSSSMRIGIEVVFQKGFS